jgi:hypothetical protein
VKYKNSYTYFGEFKKGLRNGYGELYFKDGDIHKGYYENDKKSKIGLYYWKKTGSIMVGQYVEERLEGYFKIYQKDSSSSTEHSEKWGFYVNDTFQRFYKDKDEFFDLNAGRELDKLTQYAYYFSMEYDELLGIIKDSLIGDPLSYDETF